MMSIMVLPAIMSSYATAAFTMTTLLIPREGVKPLTLAVFVGF